jgi:hypothetical protein
MCFADATRSPQVKIVRIWIERLCAFESELITASYFELVEGEVPTRFFAAEKFEKVLSAHELSKAFLTPPFNLARAWRADTFE